MPELLLQHPPLNEQLQPKSTVSFESFPLPAEQDQFTLAEQAALAPEAPTFGQRLAASRVGQTVVRGLVCLGLASGGVAIAATPANAESSHVYTIENTDGDGVWLHGDPGLGDKGDLITVVPEGARIAM